MNSNLFKASSLAGAIQRGRGSLLAFIHENAYPSAILRDGSEKGLFLHWLWHSRAEELVRVD